MLRRIETSTAQGRDAFEADLDLQDAFEADLDLQDATLRRLQTLSESVQRLSGEFREAHPEVPWDLIAGMRNRLVHAYLDVDLDIIWNTVLSDLPPVRAVVDRAHAELRAPESADPT